jgi:TolA-binding protein
MEGSQQTPTPRAACPDPISLTRAVSQGADEALLDHVRGCAICGPAWQEQHALRALGARLPFMPPAPGRRQQLRAGLMAAIAGHKTARRFPPAWLVTGGAITGALAVAAAALLWISTRVTDPVTTVAPVAAQPSRATIEAESGARFAQISGPPHEVYRLYEGTVRFTVEHAARAGETFKVVSGIGEVEVRGTIFETTATADRLVKVRVERGKVVVRRNKPLAATATDDTALDQTSAAAAADARDPDAAEMAVEAGRDWQRPMAPDADASLPEAPPASSSSPDHRASRRLASRASSVRAADPVTLAFAEGLALARKDPARAAAAFERVGQLSPDGNLAEDAAYRRASVLLLAGESNQAYEALKAFLDRFPRSAWAGEASVQLGWLLLDRGEPQGATFRFRAGLGDPSPRVRKSAQAGLDSVASSQARQRR